MRSSAAETAPREDNVHPGAARCSGDLVRQDPIPRYLHARRGRVKDQPSRVPRAGESTFDTHPGDLQSPRGGQILLFEQFGAQKPVGAVWEDVAQGKVSLREHVMSRSHGPWVSPHHCTQRDPAWTHRGRTANATPTTYRSHDEISFFSSGVSRAFRTSKRAEVAAE